MPGHVLTVAAAVLVFLALVVPEGILRHRPGVFLPGAFLRIPLEGILGAALLIAAPARARRPLAAVLGAGLGALAVLKVVNIGFLVVLGRRFNPVLDWPLFGDGYRALAETSGRAGAIGAAVGAVLGSAALAVGLTLAVLRLARLTARHRLPARRAVTALLAAWMVFALTGTTLFPAAPVASDSAAGLAKRAFVTVPAALRDRATFTAEARVDAFAKTPPSELLTALRGKDVVIGVVESYGRSALSDPLMAGIVGPALAAGDKQLAAAGFAARSGYLTSSTYGGGSWLAHASFQSGLWINNQQRYRQLVSGDRLTLTNAFHKAGWRTVGVEPGNTVAWPEAKFYGYDEVYDSRNMGYRGPRFGWSRMPDQFTLAAFQQKEYGRRHAPLMAEVTLTSSHEPWTPVPDMVDWDAVGDGTIYGPMAQRGEDRSVLWKKSKQVRTEYARSVVYSVGSLVSWAERYGDKDLVLVMFGDHQPISLVSGHGASHDVPVTIVAKDPAVLDRIAGWGWSPGLNPGPAAPVWKMSDFRDRFLTAYGKGAEPTRSPH
ncbi:phosphoglycerol transferase MdoB-like AlkP superfamily enzyme [Krasilnikovia cinnamomea]|uniref:Phosphoglycerol transferase MdoB-like AlkP superfamily enzyme n=1 Tax=Krasilnikovia cinnamomea TaxID=349313 RepID=A0A4Q7ZT09_9ACTN|nr:phosphoglycerol transferase MdoB-like AlkP superfamily enzyme [Krasilnikovia cinnamomea]